MENNKDAESVEDGTEGGYTAYSSEEFEEWFTNLPTDEQKAYVKRITVLSGPVEYITTDYSMNPSLSEEYQKALIEKYGHTELHSTVEDDTDDFGGLGEFGYEEGPEIVDSADTAEVPDEELDDDAYYGTYGYSRTAPGCPNPYCPCHEDD